MDAEHPEVARLRAELAAARKAASTWKHYAKESRRQGERIADALEAYEAAARREQAVAQKVAELCENPPEPTPELVALFARHAAPAPQDELARVRAERDALAKAVGWAWQACDQTIACPCCGVAWWRTDADLDDDWHAPGCEFQALLVRAGLARATRGEQGVGAFDPRGAPIDGGRIAAEIGRMRAAAAVARELADDQSDFDWVVRQLCKHVRGEATAGSYSLYKAEQMLYLIAKAKEATR